MRADPAVKKFCIVNFTGLRANWGCQATSWELLKFLNGAFDESALPNFTYVPLLPACKIDAEARAHIPDIYAAIDSVTERKPAASSALAFLTKLCRERYGFWVDEVIGSDIVFFQGEGTMSGSTEFRPGARLFLLPFVAKHAWNKKVLSLNQTLFGVDENLLRMVAQVCNSLDLVAVREGASFQFAQDIGIEGVRYIPDTAFLTKPADDPRLPRLDPGTRYFCLTGSASQVKDYDRHIFTIAERFRKETGLTPIVAATKDQALARLVEEAWEPGTFAVIPSEVHYPAVAHVLARCDFLLGGRYHMAIMATACGTPSILLQGNTFKNEGLAAIIKSPYPVRGLDEDAAILGDLRDLMSNFERERRRTRDAATRVAKDLECAQSSLAAALHGAPIQGVDFPLPPVVTVPAEQMAIYAAMSAKASRPTKFKKDTPKKCIGTKASVTDLLGPLQAGSEGDPHASRLAIEQIRRDRELHEKDVTSSATDLLVAARKPDIFGWLNAHLGQRSRSKGSRTVASRRNALPETRSRSGSQILFVVYPNFGLIDSWLPVLASLKKNNPALKVTALFPEEDMLSQARRGDPLTELSEHLVDSVIYRRGKGWRQTQSFLRAAGLGEDAGPSFADAWQVVASSLRAVLARDSESMSTLAPHLKNVRVVLFDIASEKSQIVRRLQAMCSEALWLSLPHGIDLRSWSLDNRAKAGRVRNKNRDVRVRAYVASKTEITPYARNFGMEPSDVRLVGVPRHSKRWIDEIDRFARPPEAPVLPQGPYLFVVSRPSSNAFLPSARKLQALKEIRTLADQELNCRVVIRRHPKETKTEDIDLFNRAFGAENYGGMWEFSNEHPFILGQSCLLCVSFFSSVAIDMAAIGVPVIERCDFSDLKPMQQFIPEENGTLTSIYQRCGFALGARTYDELRAHALEIVHDRARVVRRLRAAYDALYHSGDDPIDLITKDIEFELDLRA